MPIRVGIDVGERSVGFATVEYDDDGWPIQILNSVAHIHDGGMDPSTGKSPKSRLATAGVARRTRRLIRNRRKRLKQLDTVLRNNGFPVPDGEIPQTHDAWAARAALSRGRISDEDARKALISLAVRHMARHRGWRNPWWKYPRLAEAPTPSENLAQMLARAEEQYPGKVQGAETLGQLVSNVAALGVPIRDTQKASEHPLGALMSTQIRQEDSLSELRQILDTQEISPTVANEICEAVFSQTPPRIPKERIGSCALMPDQPRAPLASLAFQEYRVLAKLGDLRIGRDKRALTPDEYVSIADLLLQSSEDGRPRWRDVAEHIGVSPRDLVDDSLDGTGGSLAPIDRTSAKVEATFPKSNPLGAWWRAAPVGERSELILLVTDLSGEARELVSQSVAELVERDDIAELLDKLNSALESGRAAYSHAALERLNARMRELQCGVHEARKLEFQVDDTWRPPAASFDDFIEHPTVNRVNALVRRYLMNVITKWGLPDEVTVEHVRDAFAGPSALAEIKLEISKNTRKRELITAQLKEQGIENPGRSDVKRNECIERQNSVCLYCGDAIGLTTSELDHILPRAEGGSSRRDNLVAVCRECNKAKGRLPFAVFAERSPRPGVSLEEAHERVRGWQRTGMTLKSFARLKADVSRRLALTEDDEVDERSLESTAYAAREMRERIQSFLASEAQRLGTAPGAVTVYAGRITSEARKAGGVDDRLQLRAFTKKSRLDRRHHAVDAAVLTSLNPSVARTLDLRSQYQRDNSFSKKNPEWRDFRGSTPSAQTKFGEWRERIAVLADRLEEVISADQIAVVRQLRLSPRVGSVHADTVTPLTYKSINDAFTQAEILRIVDTSLYLRMDELAAAEDLEPDPRRSELQRWAEDRPVALFPTNAAYLPVRKGAVAIGDTVKYAQVYAWRANEKFNFGIVRLYVGEFPKIGFGGKGNDFLTTTPPAFSQAMRTADARLRTRINTGEAKLIGWVATDDELEIDPEHFSKQDSKIGSFLQQSPEKSWIITGFFSDSKLSIAPALLAYEGVTTAEEAASRPNGPPATPESIATVLKDNRIPLAVNVLLGSPNCTVIRRTVLGRPRWSHAHLPTSWSVLETAERAFER